ncbi:protein INSYN2B [Pogona vitticeps]
MGRKETDFLHTLNCDSMAQQGIKVRPVLLKRNSLDSVDFKRQPHHRRSKSQQVRFKDEGTDNPTVAESELEAEAAQEPCALGKMQTPQHNNLVNDSLCFPPSHKGLQNIAIQTSPSLRKHCPVFKRKRITTSKSLTEMPQESEYSIHVNGNFPEQDIISSSLSYLSLTRRLDDGPKPKTTTASVLFQRVPKAQCNGPVCLGSDKITVLEKATVSTQVPEYTHLSPTQDSFAIYGPDTQTDLCSSVHSSTAVRQSNENCSLHAESEKSLPHTAHNCNEATLCHSICEIKSCTELPAPKDDTSTTESILSSPQLQNSPLCSSLSEHMQPTQQKADFGHKTLTNDNQTAYLINNTLFSVPSCKTVMENISSNTEVPQYDNCLEGFYINAHLPGTDVKPQNKEIKEINQIHLAPSELCALQDRLQSVEESLQSNQEKIKVLLNVIQDMERARALNEGRNFYRTGQDLNNCSTCQNTACIIYSVEYDFRQQEGRFHQVLKTLDEVEESPPVVPLQRQPSDHPPITEKQEVRRKTKKKKCFWWI